jgi:hypothetical protein
MTTTTLPQTDSQTRSATSGVDNLRVLMNDALAVAADDAADRYSSRTAAGRTLLALAAVARQAARDLGTDSGTALAAGPGVVVQREVAAAVRLLDRAGDDESVYLDGLLAVAQGLHAQLLALVAATDIQVAPRHPVAG